MEVLCNGRMNSACRPLPGRVLGVIWESFWEEGVFAAQKRGGQVGLRELWLPRPEVIKWACSIKGSVNS